MFSEFVVIIPKHIKGVLPKLDKMLKPYSYEVNRTKPEIEKCYCGTEIARKETEKVISNEFPNFRDSIYIFGSENALNDYTKLVNERMETHPLYKKAIPDCKECKGIGTYTAYYNPNGKFDFWDIGYEWDAGFKTIPHREKEWLSTNDIIMVEDIPDDFIQSHTFLPIVTPDGIWHEFAELFERDQSKIDAAVKNMKETLAKYPSHKAIKCKMHF